MDANDTLLDANDSIVFSVVGDDDEISCSTITENSNSCSIPTTHSSLGPNGAPESVTTSHGPSSSQQFLEASQQKSLSVCENSNDATFNEDSMSSCPDKFLKEHPSTFNRSISMINEPVSSPPMTKRSRTTGSTPSFPRGSSAAIIQGNRSNDIPLFEYLWPQTSVDDTMVETDDNRPQDWFIIQEVLSEYLQVNSFKRKYPDIARRPVDIIERNWLVQQGLVSQQRAELGLTALRSEDVLTLLLNDYPHLHEPVTQLLHAMRVQYMRNIQKEQYESARMERTSSKLQQSRMKAVRSVQEYNHRLISERIQERRYYWDLQTQQIHVTRSRYNVGCVQPHRIYLDDKAAYPVALLPGQFAKHFRHYTPEELAYLPLNTALYSVPRSHQDWRKPFYEQDKEIELDKSKAGKEDLIGSPPTMGVCPSEDDSHSSISCTSGVNTSVTCTVCGRTASNPIKCTDCKRQGHATCLDLPEHIIPAVRSYAWSCMECKRCVECSDPGDEEAMLFCDKCDRGYHMFCVGLKTIPEGQWQCIQCTPKPPRRVIITTGE